MTFGGFQEGDFEAYAAHKWKSNVFNRERLEVKQKLLTLGREIAPGLTASDGSPLTLESSVEHPALWNHKQVDTQKIFFSRSEDARKELDAIIDRQKSIASLIEDPTPQRNHLFLTVVIAHGHSEVALRLHPDARIDRQNLERKLTDHFERERFLNLLQRLPEPFQLGLHPGPLSTAHTLDEAQLMESVTQFTAASARPVLPGTSVPLWSIGRAWPRAEVVQLGRNFLDVAQQSLHALLQLYRFIAWSRDNDFVSMREMLQKEKQTKRQKGLSRSDQVRIVRGMLSGKLGVVQDIDAKGALKILVGKLAVKVDAEDVEKV